MTLSPPTADDIANLLLLCAPPEALKELDLTVETKAEFIAGFDAMRVTLREDITALTLYYATYKLIPYRKSKELIRTLYISPEVIRSLVGLVDAESFIEVEGLLTEIEKGRRSKIGSKAVNSRHDKPGGSRDKRRQIREIWATGKYSTKDICAEEEYAGLGYKSFGAARKALSDPKAKA